MGGGRILSSRAAGGLRWALRLGALAVGVALCWGYAAVAQETNPAPPAPGPAAPPIAVPLADPDAAPRRVIDFARPWELLPLAGPVLWPLLACSLVMLTVAFERFIALRRGRVVPGGFARRFRRRLDNDEFDKASAAEFCRGNRSALAQVLLAACRQWGRPVAEVQRAVHEAGMQQVALLKRNLRMLQSVANIATLLGLLGTVIGMIHSFNRVADLRGVGRGEVLAGGIAEALVATGLGLCVAIPALALYTWFASCVETLAYDLDATATELADRIAAEAAPPGPPPRAQAALDLTGMPKPRGNPAPMG